MLCTFRVMILWHELRSASYMASIPALHMRFDVYLNPVQQLTMSSPMNCARLRLVVLYPTYGSALLVSEIHLDYFS